MAFDGIAVHAITQELNSILSGGRITKIAQPEKDELLLSVKKDGETYLLMMSANASVPLICLTDEKKENPMTAPLFCMVLRKYIGGGMIESITQPGLERCVDINISHLDEMGDPKTKILTIELMGKHSNIIFRDGTKIIESLKHIPFSVSSVREVLPGREYFIPGAGEKTDILLEKGEVFNTDKIKSSDRILQGYTGFSPSLIQELLFRAKVDPQKTVSDLTEDEKERLSLELKQLKDVIDHGDFSPGIYYDNAGDPKDFTVFPFLMYCDLERRETGSISEALTSFYNERKEKSILKSKSSDLTHILKTYIQRSAKKLDLQAKQLKDTEKRDKYRLYGELLNVYGYEAKEGDKEITVINYNDDSELTIPLDPDLSAIDNAKKYFERYGKLKRTYEALSVLVKETESELDYLKSVLMSLELAENEADLNEIKDELSENGYIKKKRGKKEKSKKSEILKFTSCDGDIIYVGKNNIQNEEITFKLADNRDWWFHAKGIPGSHVLLKSGGHEPSDKAFEEAARLAAKYSSAKNESKVEVDYVKRKEIKKPAGAKPGFVVYYTNYSMVIEL